MGITYIYRHVNTSNLVIILANNLEEAKSQLAERFIAPKEFKLYNAVCENNTLCTITLKELEKKRDETINA